MDAPPETEEFPKELLSIDAIIDAAIEGKKLPYWVENNGQFLDQGLFKPNAFEVSRLQRKGNHFELSSNPGRKFADPFDPKNMMFLEDPEEKIDDLLMRLEKAAEEAQSNNRLVLLILGHGGTIAMRPGPDGTLVNELSAADIVEEAGAALKRKYVVVDFDLCNIDSSQFQWAFTGDSTILKSIIVTKASRKLLSLLCIMTANGTDTCVENSSNQKIQLGPEFPIGDGWASANQTSVADPSDVGINILGTADLLAWQHRARLRGVFLNQGGSNGGALNPLTSRKEKDGHVNIYGHPYGDKYADLGTFLKDGWRDPMLTEYQEALARSNKSINTDFSPFIIDGPSAGSNALDLGNPALSINAQVGQSPLETLINIRVARRLKKMAVLVETFGSFTFNEQRLNVIQQECRKDMLIIASSPFARGETHEYPTAKRIRDQMGGIVTTMSPHATMIELMFAQQVWGDDREKIVACLNDRDLVGEKTRYNRPSYPEIGFPQELMLRSRKPYLGTART